MIEAAVTIAASIHLIPLSWDRRFEHNTGMHVATSLRLRAILACASSICLGSGLSATIVAMIDHLSVSSRPFLALLAIDFVVHLLFVAYFAMQSQSLIEDLVISLVVVAVGMICFLQSRSIAADALNAGRKVPSIHLGPARLPANMFGDGLFISLLFAAILATAANSYIKFLTNREGRQSPG